MEIKFKKVHTAKDLAISTIVLLAGIGLFFVHKGLGITLALCGLAMFILYKGGYKKDGQGIVLQKKSEDLCKCCKASVVEYLDGKDVDPLIRKGNEGEASGWMYISMRQRASLMRSCSIFATTPTKLERILWSSIHPKLTN